ncbi:MAG: PA2169 family four-helix-bundle protein [Pseudomonadota bacterium]|nr:PA2169 family four-helix-bundle protein [Pseudomonadota bacterium]
MNGGRLNQSAPSRSIRDHSPDRLQDAPLSSSRLSIPLGGLGSFSDACVAQRTDELCTWADGERYGGFPAADSAMKRTEQRMSRSDTVKVLNRLIQLSYDGRLGFATAAGESVRTDLRTIFESRVVEYGNHATELKRLVESIGGTPKTTGTVAATLRRRWRHFRMRANHSNRSVLEAMESAEGTAMSTYARALTASLPQQFQTVVQRQHDRTVRNHAIVRDLRNSARISSSPSLSGRRCSHRL